MCTVCYVPFTLHSIALYVCVCLCVYLFILPLYSSPDPHQTTPTDPLLATPTLIELNRQVIPHVCLDWQSVGHHLEVDPSVMKVIHDDYHDDVEKCCRTMFTRWLSHDEGTGGAPRLWRTVLKALKNVGYTSLVGDVERTLFECQ